MTGRLQVGDNDFQPRQPAEVNVAGDPDDTGGVTYKFMGMLTDLPALAEGSAIDWTLSPGSASDPFLYDDRLLGYGVTAARYVPETRHTIASPFWDFMTASGTVFQSGAYIDDQLFQNPFYATGLPLTEAYWANVKLAGVATDVLIQCFERRCLTYTPSNAAGWQVEAGNVGRHYYAWRYGSSNPPTPVATSTPTQSPAPEPTTTAAATATGSSTATASPSQSPTTTATSSATATPTATSTATATSTSTSTPTATPQPLPTGGYTWNLTWTTPPTTHPVDIDTDASGNVYVASEANSASVQSYTPAGALRWQMHASDVGYNAIRDVSVVGDGSTGIACILTDDGSATYVLIYTSQGGFIRGWQTPSKINASSIACDPWGYVTVTSGASVFWFDTVGNPYGSVTVSGKSFSDVVVDDVTEETYLVDLNGPRIVKLDNVGDYAGEWGDASGFNKLAVDLNGNVYGADLGGHRVIKMARDGHVVAAFGSSGTGDGQFEGPQGVAVDNAGNVYVTDAETLRVQRFSK